MLKTVFLDLDDTLLDFRRAERQAITRTLRHFQVEPTPEVLDRYHEINREQWELLAEASRNKDLTVQEKMEIAQVICSLAVNLASIDS